MGWVLRAYGIIAKETWEEMKRLMYKRFVSTYYYRGTIISDGRDFIWHMGWVTWASLHGFYESSHHEVFLHTRKTFLNHNIYKLIFIPRGTARGDGRDLIWHIGWVPWASLHTDSMNHHEVYKTFVYLRKTFLNHNIFKLMLIPEGTIMVIKHKMLTCLVLFAYFD